MSKLVLKAMTVMAVLSLSAAGAARAEDVVLRPPLPTNRLVVIIHGSGGRAKSILDQSEFPEVPIYLKRGFAVAASDADGLQNWGNPASVADIEHLIDRLGYERVFIESGSMGGLDTMQLLGRVNPVAVALVSPVCDISHLGPPVIPALEIGWGASRPSYLAPVVPEPAKGLPVKILASTEDTWVPKIYNADVCARELRRRGAIVHEHTIKGEHYSTHVHADVFPDFFSAVAAAVEP